MAGMFFFKGRYFDNYEDFMEAADEYNQAIVDRKSLEEILDLMRREILFNNQMIPSKMTNFEAQEFISQITITIIQKLRNDG